ncbi:ubiquitin carboxyl-terminal hydrolase 16 isoform X1 [Drosophila novamexicana]|uniref:ubiquitin carboxyl-terminal hydrolase 16 isoform X1 n=2 Tax=Drosophila novamexicana TaxID=47314 RepID=UPI0011E5B600|nr:ubiquitin carboxyl-terminal hydrolase 16 isoform X1 [Drosophila novamexicana]
MENRVRNCYNNKNNSNTTASDNSNNNNNNSQIIEKSESTRPRFPYCIYHYLERTIRAVVLLVARVLATVYSYSISVRVSRETRRPLGQLRNRNSCSGIMVKKRQTDAQEGTSSTDSGEEELMNGHAGAGSVATVCQHIKKAVDTTRLRRQLKSTGLLYECQQCQKLNLPNGTGGDSTDCEYDNTLWLCLKCGTQLCGRQRNEHALQHFKKPHSDSHALALNTRSFKIWCYECDNEVSANSRKNLLECVELVKRLAQKPPTAVANAKAEAQPTINNIQYKIMSSMEHLSPIVPMTGGKQISLPVNANGGDGAIPLPPPPPPPTSIGSVPGIAKRVLDKRAIYQSVAAATQASPSLGSPELDRLPRVRGLTNLGNTCFFNAVMQCLAQTPFLLAVLKELAEPGEQFVLPGGTFNFKGKGDIELPMIKGTLSSWGNLTAALANALEELQSGGGVFTPSKLFDKLCAKCPQFTGGDQHDAHELLRQLLESVRSEDLKRYQRVILQNLGYKDQDINSVSEELRQKCKIYGNQAADRILRPEQVFRGFLVSTLTCQDCFNVSSRHEYFLDMSLPVAVEKPQPPQRRKTSPENSPASALNSSNTKLSNGESDVGLTSPPFYLHADGQEPLGPSKAQVKKEKERERKAKRAAKHQRTKQAQKLSLKLNINDESNGGGGGGDGDADVDQQPGSGDGQGQVQPLSADTDGEKTRSAAWGEGPRADTLSLSATTSEHSDADVEDNLVEDTATGSGAKFYTDNNGNAQPLSEKRDDTPEHMDKDSLEEDENDSGIATSPAPTTTNSAASTTSNKSNNNNNNNNGASNVAETNNGGAIGSTVASLVNAGLSEEGASQMRQFSSGQLQLQLQMEQLKLREQAQIVARSKRVRTQSYSDWSTTIAPRYQCEVGECSVPSCLNNFTAVELMTGQNKVGCESCTRRINGPDPQAKSVNTNATKQLLVSSPPAVLILHLKRFQLGPRCIFRKLTQQVSYSVLLDIAAFCGSKVKNLPNIDRKQKKLLYALYGVVEHSGGLYGGHYTAYVKVRPKVTPDDKRWKFLPHGSKAELDQDDEQLKKLEELLVKEKAREMRMNAMDDSDDFTSSSSNASTSDEASSDLNNGLADDEPTAATSGDQPAGMANGEADEAANVQPPPGKWYYVSDSRVQEVSEKTALKAQAYLLFYERIY